MNSNFIIFYFLAAQMNQKCTHTEKKEINNNLRIDDGWDVQDVQDVRDNENGKQFPSLIHLNPPQRLNIKKGRRRRKNLKPDLIKLFKCQKSQQKEETHPNSQTKGMNKTLEKQCRICLEDQSSGEIIKPCKCTGTIQYVHQRCLCEWIKRKINVKVGMEIHCQVCQFPFDYKISKRYSFSCQILKKNYEKYKSTYLCFLFVMLILIIMWTCLTTLTIIGLSGSANNVIRQTIFQSEQTRIIFICIVLIYFLILSFVSLLFLAEYAVKTQFVIKNVHNFSRKSNKIAPKYYISNT